MKSAILKSLFIVCVLAGVSCSGTKKAKQEVEELPKVTVQKVSKRNVVQQSSYTGTVEAYVVNNIAPQSARRISEILVDVGDHVKEGQLLVKLDNSSLIQAKVQMENALTEYERTNELYEFGGASKSDRDSRLLTYEVAKSTYDNLLENTTLISPTTGVVSARNYDNGDMFAELCDQMKRFFDERSPKLRELAAGKKNAVLIISDHTRPVPCIR